MEGIPWWLAGHSMGLEPPFADSASDGAGWITRLQNELQPSSFHQASVGGHFAADTAARVIGTVDPIGPAFRGLFMLDVGTNDLSHLGSAKSLAGVEHATRSIVAAAQAQAKLAETAGGAFAYAGVWQDVADAGYASGAARFTSTPDGAVTVTLPAAPAGLFYHLLLRGTDDASALVGCAAVEVKLDGAVLTTVDLGDQMQATTDPASAASQGVGAYTVRVPADGTERTLVVTHKGAAGTFLIVDDVLLPSETPAQVVVLGQHPFAASSYGDFGGDATLDKVNRALRRALVGFDPATVTFVDLAAAYFAPSKMSSSVDQVHPNDWGHAVRMETVATALARLPFRAGMNVM